MLGLGRPGAGGLGFEPRTRRRRGGEGWWGLPEVVDEEEGKKGRRAHTVGGGGGEGIVRVDFGAREAMGRGCGLVGAAAPLAASATANSLIRSASVEKLWKSTQTMADGHKTTTAQADPTETRLILFRPKNVHTQTLLVLLQARMLQGENLIQQ